MMALGDGLVIFCSQYWEMKKTEPMKRIVAAAMQAAVAVCAILFLLVSLLPEQALRLFTTDEAIVKEGVRYLGTIRFTYLFFAVTQILLSTLCSVEMVKIAFFLSLQTLFINCAVNYVLIYGKFGAPQLGVTGAAIGTLTARVIECGVLIFYVAKKEKNLRLRLKDYFKFSKTFCLDYLKITGPMVDVQGLWGLNTAMQTAILGHMTSAAIAANSAASTLFLLVKSIPSGAASTASILIGKKIGEGDLDMVRNYARVLHKMFVAFGIVSGLLLFFLRMPVLGLYDLSEETKVMADRFLLILSVVAVFMSYQMPTNNGIIRGGGNATFVVRMDLISIWLIVIPLSFIMAFWFKASPVAVVCCLNADQVFKCVPAFLEANYGRWIRKLTRDS